MRDTRLIMREAHRMTKEIKREFPQVDYRSQLGISLKFIYIKLRGENMIKNQEVKKEVLDTSELNVLMACGLLDEININMDLKQIEEILKSVKRELIKGDEIVQDMNKKYLINRTINAINKTDIHRHSKKIIVCAFPIILKELLEDEGEEATLRDRIVKKISDKMQGVKIAA